MVESHLHIVLKKAVERHHAQGSRCWFETTMQPWGGGGSLRVDVSYTRNLRYHYVECETKPNLKRLIEKGRRKNEYKRRADYRLVVPESEYFKHDWRMLRGYFDVIYAYDAKMDAFTNLIDLRFMGLVRDAVLDVVVPIIRGNKVQSAYKWLLIRKNILRWTIRRVIQCSACKLGIQTPWIFCPRNDCPDSEYGY